MATIITYPSALEYWLYEKGIPYYYFFDHTCARVKNKEILQSKTLRKDIIRSIDSVCFSLPVHVAVPSYVKRNSTEDVVFHRLSYPCSESSFLKISDELYIVSPELCFVQAAEYLSVPELVVLANDLCGIYIRDEQEDFGQRRRETITTVDSIRSYINQAKGIKGLKTARIAIEYALDRSNSPMESKLAALAVLPVFRGGYGLIKPQLNLNVKLTKEATEYIGSISCCCDMVWMRKRVILEYDSNLSHLRIEQHYKDKKRSTALNLSGFKVINITAEQVRNFRSIENMFLQVRNALGIRTYKTRMDKFFEMRWKVVHDIMFDNKMEYN